MTKKTAFSLVELSIVLVILGLLVGGILAGQSLIRAAELRTVTTSINKYSSAVMAFRDKYFGLPGDYSNAKAFWTTCTDVLDNPCNGNADGIIDGNGAATRKEMFRAWQHLAFAGLIEGTYTGLHNGTGPGATVGVNIPAGKLGVSGYYMGTTGGYTAQSNSINFLNPGPAGIWGYVIKPEEAWNIDTKMDDGKPDAGIAQTYNGWDGAAYVTSCVTSVSQWVGPATYNLNVTGTTCAMRFATLP